MLRLPGALDVPAPRRGEILRQIREAIASKVHSFVFLHLYVLTVCPT